MSLISFLAKELDLEILSEQSAWSKFLKLGALDSPPVEEAYFRARKPVCFTDINRFTVQYYEQCGFDLKISDTYSLQAKLMKQGEEIADVSITNFSHTATRKIMLTVTPRSFDGQVGYMLGAD